MGDKRHYCVFCCRQLFHTGLPEEDTDEDKVKNNLVHQFFKLFTSYCSKRFKKLESYQYNVCDNCTVVLRDFNELYSQIDCLRLKVNWRLETLKNIMEQANKVPSRQHAFGPPGMENDRKYHNEEIRKFRTHFVNDCKYYNWLNYLNTRLIILQ